MTLWMRLDASPQVASRRWQPRAAGGRETSEISIWHSVASGIGCVGNRSYYGMDRRNLDIDTLDVISDPYTALSNIGSFFM